MEQQVAIGLKGHEIFIAKVDLDDAGHPVAFNDRSFSVIRTVSANDLDEYRTNADTVADYWRDAVRAERTTQGLEDWFHDIIDMECSGDEDFPGKDSSFVEYVSDEDREKAAQWLKDNDDYNVGTWEASGWFCPDDMDFDLVLCSDEILEFVKKSVEDRNLIK